MDPDPLRLLETAHPLRSPALLPSSSNPRFRLRPNCRLSHLPETVNKSVNKIVKNVDGPTQMSRPRPYSWSEVIHRAGDESFFPAFERERPRIVNNFAASASSGYELSSISEKMNSTRLSNLAIELGSATNTQMRTNRLLRRLRLAIRNSHPARAARNDHYPLLEYERICLRATA